MNTRTQTESGLNVIVHMKERYEKAVHYRCFALIYRSERYDDHVASESQKMRKKATVQMTDQASDGKDGYL